MAEKPHKRLLCWQLSFKFAVDIYPLTSHFPSDEKFGLTSQIRRAASSIPTNIAEGAGRNTKKEFINFLYIASGSLSELDTLIMLATELGYFSKDNESALFIKLEEISKFIAGLIKKLKE
jgi:four helix bundle protein